MAKLNSQGMISPLIAGAILAFVIVIAAASLYKLTNFRFLAGFLGSPSEEASQTLEDLLNIPFADKRLDPGQYVDPDNPRITWSITSVKPRLKRIVVVVKKAKPGEPGGDDQGVSMDSFKYDDF